jgi:hypothetical protein
MRCDAMTRHHRHQLQQHQEMAEYTLIEIKTNTKKKKEMESCMLSGQQKHAVRGFEGVNVDQRKTSIQILRRGRMNI